MSPGQVRLLTVAEAAERVGVGTREIGRWISGGLPAISVGNRRLIRLDQLQERARLYYAERNRPKARPNATRRHTGMLDTSAD